MSRISLFTTEFHRITLSAQSARGGLTCIVGIFHGVLPAIASGCGEAGGSVPFRGKLLQFIEVMIVAIDVPKWRYLKKKFFYFASLFQ